MTSVALLPSPLLGGAVWAPVAEELHELGVDVVAAPGSVVPPVGPDDALRQLLDSLPGGRELVLVPHSNAGLYAPLVATERRVAGFVFVDAILPPPAGEVPVAPPAFLAWLETLADPGGILPPWTEWWAGDDLDDLYPDTATRLAVAREAPRLPLSYFRSSVAVPNGWDRLPGAYLAFGDTYADERSEAASHGWPTATIKGAHLHQLHDPPGVADKIITLATKVGIAKWGV